MSGGSRKSKESPSIELPPAKKAKSKDQEAGQQSGVHTTQMTIRELGDLIYKREDICTEEAQTKKKWYLRDARVRDQEGVFQKPCLWLEVIPSPKKEVVQYGPIMTAVLSDFEQKGPGGSTLIREYFLFLDMGGPKGFVAIVLDPLKFDYSLTKKIENDQVCQAILESHKGSDSLSDFLNFFHSNGKIFLFPIIEAHYKKVSEETVELKTGFKLKVIKPKDTPRQSEVSSEEASEKQKKPPRQKRSNRTATPQKGPGSRTASTERTVVVEENQENRILPAVIPQNTISSADNSDGEQMTTTLARAKVSQLRSKLQRLMDHKRVQITTVALMLDNLILNEDANHPNSTLVHPLDKIHIENIKMLMMQKTGDFTVPFVLWVDRADCPTMKDWSIVNCLDWKYRVISGNHGAQAKLDLWKAYKMATHYNIQARVYADLSKQDIHTLGLQHNIDQEYRKKMTNIDLHRRQLYFVFAKNALLTRSDGNEDSLE